jgi:hypothetical protein
LIRSVLVRQNLKKKFFNSIGCKIVQLWHTQFPFIQVQKKMSVKNSAVPLNNGYEMPLIGFGTANVCIHGGGDTLYFI